MPCFVLRGLPLTIHHVHPRPVWVLTWARPGSQQTGHMRGRGQRKPERTIPSLPLYSSTVFYDLANIVYRNTNTRVYLLYLIIHALYNIYDHESWNLRYLLKQCLHMVCLQTHISNLKWYVKKSWKISSFQSSAAEWGHRLAAPGICRAASAAAEWGRRGSPGFAQRSAELEVRNPNRNTGTTAW